MLRLTQKLLAQDWIPERTDEQRRVASLRARRLARKTLGRAHRKLVTEGDRLQRHNDHDVHQLRIRIKKLRYASELLAPLFRHKATRPNSKRRYLSRLGALQQILGELNDMANAGRLLEQLAGNSDSDRRTTLAYLRSYADAMSCAALADFDAAWQRFVKTKPFW
jgi:CHAD domain-containing protein